MPTVVATWPVDPVAASAAPERPPGTPAGAWWLGGLWVDQKPLATTVADAETLAVLAEREGRCCVANLVERYNPLADAVRDVIRSNLLGDLVHGLFVNDAADEGLGPGHWFWNRSVSGGIFVEHGVHFFDLVASWLGHGEVVAAARSVRPPRPLA